MTARIHRLTPLALAVALASSPASALTLGELETRSALGQPFQGRILLSNLGETSADEIKPAIATQEQYNQLNVRNAYLHTQFRLALVEDAGQSYIEVRSPDTVDEPILNFVLTVRWPKGHMAKEFLVLLDPPALQPARRTLRAPQPRPKPVASGDSYRTQSGDSLWLIAQSLKPANVSMSRAMNALFELNPDAFINGNRNLLRRGYLLQLPSWTAPTITTPTAKPVLPEAEAQLPALDPASEPSVSPISQPTEESAAPTEPTATTEAGAIRTRIDTVNERVETLQTELATNQAKLTAMQAQLEQLILLQQQLLSTQAELINSTQQAQIAVEGKASAQSPITQPDQTSAGTESSNLTPAPAAPTEQSIQPPVQEAQPAQPVETPLAASEEQPATQPAAASPANRWLFYLAALLLGAIMFWLAWRRRTLATDDDTTIDEPVTPQSDMPQAITENTPETASELGEDDDSDPEWLQVAANDGHNTHADPLLDANIYLVYGRLDEADRLLAKALHNEPERVDLRLLQLKLYQQQNDRQRFEDAANQLEPLADEYERRQIGQLRDKFPNV